MTAHYSHHGPFGAKLLDGRHTGFSLWAPGVETVVLEIDGQEPQAMERSADGTFTCIAETGAGTAYLYRVAPELRVPDPASRMQRDDVHGPSVVVDPEAFVWQHTHWQGRPWHEMVIYEVHVGCFGGFTGVMQHLEDWVALGITAVELMPIADFAGSRNWGYDGVLPYAPDRAYGTPEQLKALIDAAHGLGLCVYLDVVYNHFGPQGNYLHSYAPQFFDEEQDSPWGASINFAQRAVRDFFTHNAIYWLNEYRFDGLRFDAVHAIPDPGWLDEMAAQVRDAIEPGRHVHLVLENERNTSAHLEKAFDAQWNDDIHNVIHVLLTGEREGYYGSYQNAPAKQLARALKEGFVYQGEPVPAKGNRPRGTPSGHLHPSQFVFFLQNHDQVGNRAFGERLTLLADPGALRAAVILQLLCPQVPLLFMGEERGLTSPFLFFTDFTGELADAVREGRRREFSAFSHFSGHRGEEIPDPNAPQTFHRSADPLRTDVAQMPSQQRAFTDFYRHLLTMRRERIVPFLPEAKSRDAQAIGERAVVASWWLGPDKILWIGVNLGDGIEVVTPFTGQLIVESKEGVGMSARRGQLASCSASVFIEYINGDRAGE